MILTIVGVGPGDPDLITFGAVKALSAADLVLVPCSKEGRESLAEEIIRAQLPALKTERFIFPMTNDGEARDNVLREQIRGFKNRWSHAESVVLPVTGDSTLYATGAYLFDIWRELAPDIELKLIPGVSAHALAASSAGSFLAMGEENLAIIPGTAGAAAAVKALRCADVAAIYKPSALKNDLEFVAESSGPWKKIIRVDRAGLAGENITSGGEALAGSGEYISIMLFWR